MTKAAPDTAPELADMTPADAAAEYVVTAPAVPPARAIRPPLVRVGLPYGSLGALFVMARQLSAPVMISMGSMFRDGKFTPIGRAADFTDAAVDSGGFTAMMQGGYRWTVSEHVDFIVTCRGDGARRFPWAWWAAMDYCCEPEIASNRAEVERRMRLTVETFGETLDYLNDWRQEGVNGVPNPVPTLQGRTADDYVRCACEMAAVIDAHDPCTCPFTDDGGENCPAEWHREHAGLPELVGIGSVCRRPVHGPEGILTILAALDPVLPAHVRLHLFGVKGATLGHIAPYLHRIASIDSMAWDFAARESAKKMGVPYSVEHRAAEMATWYGKQQARIRVLTQPQASPPMREATEAPPDEYDVALDQRAGRFRDWILYYAARPVVARAVLPDLDFPRAARLMNAPGIWRVLRQLVAPEGGMPRADVPQGPMTPWTLMQMWASGPMGPILLLGVRTPDGWIYTERSAISMGAISPAESGGWEPMPADERANILAAPGNGKWAARAKHIRAVESNAEKLIREGRNVLRGFYPPAKGQKRPSLNALAEALIVAHIDGLDLTSDLADLTDYERKNLPETLRDVEVIHAWAADADANPDAWAEAGAVLADRIEGHEPAPVEADDPDLLAPVEAPASPAEAPSPTSYADAGDLLPGARKHLWKPGERITAADLPEIERQPAGTISKYLTKAYVFGPFPWEEEQDAGSTPAAAVLKDRIWRTIAKGPGEHPESRRLYVKAADWLKGKFADLRTAAEVADFLEEWKVAVVDSSQVLGPMTLPEILDRLGLKFGHDGSAGTGYYDRGGVTYTFEALPPDVEARVSELNRSRYQPGSDNRAISNELAELRAPYKVVITGRDLRNAGFGPVIAYSQMKGANGERLMRLTAEREEYKRYLNDVSNRDNPRGYLFALAGFDTATDLRDARKSQLVQLVHGGGSSGFSTTVLHAARDATWESLLKDSGTRIKVPLWRRATTDQRREGPDTKRPPTLLGEELIRAFRFRGDQFGEWVTQDERGKHRALAWDAFADLARITGLPWEEIGACGRLGIAFGARGHGKASAHYEAINGVTNTYFPVINLTNTRGDGSLAHEWGHFFDHHMSPDPTRIVRGKDGPTCPYISGGRAWSAKAAEGVTPEVTWAMQGVLDAMRKPRPEDVPAMRAERDEAIRNAQAETARLNREYREKKLTRAEYEKAFEEAKTILKYAPEVKLTRYANDAEALGEYWARPTEMFARAFESFCEDELHRRGEVNTYLVYGTRETYDHKVVRGGVIVGGLEPYPQGAERERINEAIRKLLAAIRRNEVLCRGEGT